MVVFPLIGLSQSLIDTLIGMGYGIIGSPLLLILGFSYKLLVSSILVSRAVAGIVAVVLHQRQKNVNYSYFRGDDFGIVVGLKLFVFTQVFS